MKILFLTSITMKSGTGLRIWNIANYLGKMGHDVYLIGKDVEKSKHIKIIDTTKRCKILSYINNITKSIKILNDEFDIVISSKPHPVSCFPVLIKRPRATCILDFDDLEHSYWKGTWIYPFIKLFEKIFLKHFDYITTHNGYIQKYLIKSGINKEKILYLPQGIECDMFKTNKKIKISGKKKTILYMAHLGIASKNLEFIFHVIKKLSERRHDIVFVVIGAGKYLNYFKNIVKNLNIEKYVKFVGYVAHKDIPKYLNTALVAINYMEETEANLARSSIKIREYLASGIPVVCNIFGPDLKQFKKFVFEFKTGDIENCAKQIEMALKAKRNKNAIKYIFEKFDWKFIIKNFEKTLQHL